MVKTKSVRGNLGAYRILAVFVLVLLAGCRQGSLSGPSGKEAKCEAWIVDSEAEWKEAEASSVGLVFAGGLAEPEEGTAYFESVLKSYDSKRRAESVTFKQSPAWDNWIPIPSVAPEGSHDAPVFVAVGDKDYWYLACKGKPDGYHAWHSTDMKSWEHCGPVTEGGDRWVTSAEYVDGKFYVYYDNPNDEDPHLVIDSDLYDGKAGKRMGEVFADPSHGSDAGIFRAEDGSFHLIYEDWSPLNAREHSWDSPLAGHSDSPDGIHGFEPHEYTPPIDERSRPTDKFGTYVHGTTRDEYRYRIHEGPQNAYGDYTVIQVGPQYYIFCDYDPHNEPMRVGYWTSDSLYKQFDWGGDVGMDFHPDPTIGFAEGKFYLIVQRHKNDFVSPGPWVQSVQARVGVDTDGDGEIDKRTQWQEVKERYSHKKGFVRIVEAEPARIDLSSLPRGFGFKFEFRMSDATENKSRPVMDSVTLRFE